MSSRDSGRDHASASALLAKRPSKLLVWLSKGAEAAPLRISVEGHRGDEDETGRDGLPERRDAEQIEAVCNHPQEKDADDRAGHAAAPASKWGASDNHGGDGGKLVSERRLRRRARRLADEDNSRYRRAQGRENVDGKAHPRGVDAHLGGRGGIAAHGVDV